MEMGRNVGQVAFFHGHFTERFQGGNYLAVIGQNSIQMKVQMDKALLLIQGFLCQIQYTVHGEFNRDIQFPGKVQQILKSRPGDVLFIENFSRSQLPDLGTVAQDR